MTDNLLLLYSYPFLLLFYLSFLLSNLFHCYPGFSIAFYYFLLLSFFYQRTTSLCKFEILVKSSKFYLTLNSDFTKSTINNNNNKSK